MINVVAARLTPAVLLAALVVMASPSPARAHALLSASEPAQGARLDAAPDEVRLTLTEPPDAAASSIRVLNAQGASVHGGEARANGLELSVSVPDLPDGVYTVTWRVLSRVDGHVTGGAFAFGVRADPSSAKVDEQSAVGPKPSIPGVAGRALLYAGVFALVGAAVAMWAFGGAVRLPLLQRAGWVAAAVGVLLIALGQAREAEIALADLLGSSIGTSFLWRAGPLLLAGVAVLLINRSAVAAILAIVGFGAHVFYGHAGASEARTLAIGAQVAHVTAAAIWIGGLLALVAALGRVDADIRARAANRYSSLALIMFVLVAALGTIRALDEVGSFAALTTTTYGRIVLLKIGLLAVLLGLGAVNRFRAVPRVRDDERLLSRVGRIELVVAALVLLASGVLASVAPASSAKGGEERAVTATGVDFGRTVRATLRVTPGGAGPNRFAVTLRSPDSDDAVDAEEVLLRFIYAGAPAVQATELVLAPRGEGTYEASGANLAVPGPWVVVVSTRTGVNTAEVRLAIGTRTKQQVTPIEQPGAPTIYDIALANGRVQMYLQPGEPGINEVHATFFDAEGNEERVLDPVLVATPPAGDPRRLRVRVLTPGHFVSDTELTSGLWRFDVFAKTRSGGELTAWFEQRIGT